MNSFKVLQGRSKEALITRGGPEEGCPGKHHLSQVLKDKKKWQREGGRSTSKARAQITDPCFVQHAPLLWCPKDLAGRQGLLLTPDSEAKTN